MLFLSRRLIAAISVSFLVKLLLTLFAFPLGFGHPDFYNWVHLAANMYSQLVNGVVPSIDSAGVYGVMSLFLTPFYAAWSMLPIVHPSLEQALSTPVFAERAPLVLLMKLPIISFDLITGVAILLIVRNLGSSRLAAAAFFLWYLNPFSFLVMELWGEFDVVATGFMMVAILLAMRERWVYAGLLLGFSTVLRFFPLFVLPFFLLASLRQRNKLSSITLLAGFAVPILSVILTVLLKSGSLLHVLNFISSLATTAPYLADYFQGIPRGSSVPTGFFSLIVQAYLFLRYWKSSKSLVNGSLAGLLILTTASTPLPYHYVWVIALATASCALGARKFRSLFLLLMICACMSLAIGFNGIVDPLNYPPLLALENLVDGVFWGVKIIYLVELNIAAMELKSWWSVL